MSESKYLNHRQKFFASILPSILPCAQISSEDQEKVFSDETLLNGDIYTSLTVPPSESPLPILLSPILPLDIGIVIRWLPPTSDANAKAATKALVATEATSRPSRTMRWRLTTRGRGGGRCQFRWQNWCWYLRRWHGRCWAAAESIQGRMRRWWRNGTTPAQTATAVTTGEWSMCPWSTGSNDK